MYVYVRQARNAADLRRDDGKGTLHLPFAPPFASGPSF